jgi:hypothetical protein
MINNSYTKTIGNSPDNFSVISIMDITYYDFYSSTSSFTLNIIKNDKGVITSITQYLSKEDLNELAVMIWEAQRKNEQRQKEYKEKVER